MIFDHSMKSFMDTMAISKFKATCLATLEKVRVTGRPLRITRFGKPVADIVPPAADAPKPEWMGSLKGTVEIRGDIVGPVADPSDWEVLR
jgi:antitoxin (DNA-binding transcriptional repressor) of toxin-antitoxin stability system